MIFINPSQLHHQVCWFKEQTVSHTLPWDITLHKLDQAATLLLDHVRRRLRNCEAHHLHSSLHTTQDKPTVISLKEIDHLLRQALALVGHCPMKKDGYLLTLGEALSPHRLIPLTRSNTRSLPSNHHPFLNSTSKLVVVAMSLDLQKLSTLQFVAVLPLELVILLLPGGQFQTQL
jgi:hypothetical protein